MELPEYYYPTSHCPQKPVFAAHGSYSQIDCRHSEGLVECRPQKGLGIVKGLQENLPPIPLYDSPLQEHHATGDSILGLDQLENTLNRFISSLTISQTENMLGKYKNYEKLLKEYLKKPDDINKLEELQKGIPFWMVNMLKSYSKIKSAFNKDCLQGYNRDFYQGLLCHKQSSSSTTLFHAAGEDFRNIYMTKVSQESFLHKGEKIANISMGSPVYQLKMSEKGVLCARSKCSCSVIAYCESEQLLEVALSSQSNSHFESLTDISPSPYLSDEILLSAEKGSVRLWNLSSSCKDLLRRIPDPKSQCSWTSAYFAGHPRQIMVSDCRSMAMFDHRDHFQKGVDLFTLPSKFAISHEQLMASCTLGFPYHLTATNHFIYLLDQRFPQNPVLQWSTESITAPQFLNVCHFPDWKSDISNQHFVFAGTQQPAEIVCFPLNLQKGAAPTSDTLPWKVGKYRDLLDLRDSAFNVEWLNNEKHFESSLAGMTVVDHSSQNQPHFTVYQMDAYGDIFFQNFQLTKEFSECGSFSCVPVLEEAKMAASSRTCSFMDVLHESLRGKRDLNSSILSDDEEEKMLSFSCFKDIFSGSTGSKYSQVNMAPSSITYREFEEGCSSKSILSLKDLPTTGSNTRLLLCMKEKEDITMILQEREKDHLEKKTALHEKYLCTKQNTIKKAVAQKKNSVVTPKKTKAASEPKKTKAASEPQNTKAASEPQDTKTVGTSQKKEPVNTSMKTKAFGPGEPHNTKAVVKPKKTKAVGPDEPQNTKAVVKPKKTKAVGESLNTEAACEPQNTKAVVKPKTTKAVGESHTMKVAGEPQSTKAFGEPQNEKASSDQNAGTEPRKEEAMGSPKKKRRKISEGLVNGF